MIRTAYLKKQHTYLCFARDKFDGTPDTYLNWR